VTEYIVAVFDTEAAAEAKTLRAAGFRSSASRRYRPDGREGGATAFMRVAVFGAWLLGEESPQATSSSYPH
jgi:hypothetical protein